MLAYLFFVIGFLLLVKGAHILIKGASSLAKRWGLSDFVIGLTIVAFGTTAPEFFISIIASFKDAPELILGNIIGGSIARVLLALGVAALAVPLVIKRGTVSREIPFSLFSLGILYYVANDRFFHANDYNLISKIDGLVLLGLFVLFLIITFVLSKIHGREKISFKKHSLASSWLMIGVGSLSLALGGKWVVDGAVLMAQSLRVSEAMISLTVIAIGTTLPEIVTSIAAALKKSAEIALGNVIGANIFNFLLVIGASALIRPIHFPERINLDILIFTLATILLIIFLLYEKKGVFSFLRGKKYKLARWEGGVLVLIYIFYLMSVVIRR